MTELTASESVACSNATDIRAWFTLWMHCQKDAKSVAKPQLQFWRLRLARRQVHQRRRLARPRDQLALRVDQRDLEEADAAADLERLGR